MNRKKVTIARSISNHPSILLLDEPTFVFLFFSFSSRSSSHRGPLFCIDLKYSGDLDTVNTAIVMKLLTELNIKESLSSFSLSFDRVGVNRFPFFFFADQILRSQEKTLVMVTHDVGLKYFADRVIWLRDGKIQRIEIVSKEKKRETLEQLDHNLHV